MPAATRPTNDDRIRAAQWFAGQGFGIFPLWSTREDGVCKCPAAAGCGSPGKHPTTANGFLDASLDPATIAAALSDTGEPNYGMVPPEGVFIWDVDTDDERAELQRLAGLHGELPATLRSRTANGEHVFWRWPEGLPRPLKRMFGLITRWGSGRQAGYVVGPRSIHASGAFYEPVEETGFVIEELPEAWARVAIEGEPGTVTVVGRSEPSTVTPGHRHDWLRDTARFYAGTVRDPDALFAAVWAANLKLPDPKTEADVHRAIGEVLTRFAPDPVVEDPLTGEVRVETGGEPPMMSPANDDSLFPPDPSPLAFQGLLGECTSFLLDGTDAPAVGVLASLVSFCGALAPAWGYWHGRHTSSPFLALVGKSGIGRKGTAMFRVRDALGNTLGMDTVNRVRFDGIASGEALVKALLDRSQATFGVPTGVLFEEEYATFLASSGREGSNLDSRMRATFDGKALAHRRVGETIYVPEPYWLSGLVAITPEELQARVTKASFKNGSGNRWLWLPVVRRDVRVVSTEPIFPIDLSEALVAAHQVNQRTPARIDPGTGVDDLLAEYDDYLRAESSGLAADMTRRYGVIAFRIALVHAAVERSVTVQRAHVERAIALTEYGRSGLPYVFGDAQGDESATYLFRMLLESDEGQLPQWTITRHFIRDPIKRQAAIDGLCNLGLAEVVKVPTRGRTGAWLRLTLSKRDFRPFFPLFGNAPQANPDLVHGMDGSAQTAVKKGARNRKEGARSRDSADRVIDYSTGEAELRTDAGWDQECKAYDSHRSSHRMGGAGWTCVACYPPEEPDPLEDAGAAGEEEKA